MLENAKNGSFDICSICGFKQPCLFLFWVGKEITDYDLKPGGIPLSVVRPCLHGAVCHCQTQNNFMIRRKNGDATVKYG